MDGAPQHRQVHLDNPLHESVRVRGRFKPVLESLEPSPAIEHRRGLQHRVAKAGGVAYRGLASVKLGFHVRFDGVARAVLTMMQMLLHQSSTKTYSRRS